VLAFDPAHSQYNPRLASGVTALEETVLGWKTAAFAALGDIVEAFFSDELEDVGDDPSEGSRDGVKLGESTLKRFLLALPRGFQLMTKSHVFDASRLSTWNAHLSNWFEFILCGS
jgi:hypothetical protein